MQASYVLLTHFSQRYPKIPVIDDVFKDRVAIAFDLMTVPLSELSQLPPLLPALKLLFETSQEDIGNEIDTVI